MAKDTVSRLEITCKYVDQNTETAYKSFTTIRKSNRRTKAKVKEAIARARHLEKIAKRLLNKNFEESLQRSIEEDDFDVSMLPPDEPQQTEQQPQPTATDEDDNDQVTNDDTLEQQ
eukprot:gene20934-22990_t